MAFLVLAPLLLACALACAVACCGGERGEQDARLARPPGSAPVAGGGALEVRAVVPAQQCPAETVDGIDVFDGQGAIDWAAVRAAGIAFALIKATQGTYDTQSTFPANWQGARHAGVARGAYHFFDPTEDGAAQALHFLAVIGSPSPGDLPPVLDIECPDGAPDCLGTGLGGQGAAAASAIGQQMRAFLGQVEQASGRRPVIYSFATYFASNGVDTTGLETYPLFLAWPGDAGACFEVPAPWAAATFWQYSFTGAVPGVAVAVDRDRFLGSPGALQALGGRGRATHLRLPEGRAPC